MKHKIKNCTLIFLLFFLFSCGFKAINSKNDNLIEIEDIQIIQSLFLLIAMYCSATSMNH